MKTHQAVLAAVTLGFTLATVHGQTGPDFGGYMSKLFADNSAYTANIEIHSYGAAAGNGVTVQGNLAYLNGNTRFQMDISDPGDANLPRQDASSPAQMGMDTMIAISCPATKVNYFVYPGMKAYVRRPMSASEAAATTANYNVDVTRIGAESVMGQNCIKNKVVVTGSDGIAHESTVWNATDWNGTGMNKFPIKIETAQNGATIIIFFKDVNLGAPDAALFGPPADYKQYNNFMDLMHGSAGAQAAR